MTILQLRFPQQPQDQQRGCYYKVLKSTTGWEGATALSLASATGYLGYQCRWSFPIDR